MKHIITGILTAVVLLCPTVLQFTENNAITASAEEGIYGDLTYTTYSTYVQITSCDKSVTSVEIPAEIDGLPVTHIYVSAFEDCTNLTQVVIPETVTIIAGHAFRGCTSLADIQLPESVTSVSADTFENTAWYHAQPDGMVYLDDLAYCYKGEMPEETSLSLKEGTTWTTLNVLSGQANLVEISLPSTLKSIQQSAFSKCPNLKTVHFSEGLENIGIFSFRSCTALTEVTFPKSLKRISMTAFSDCTALQSVTMQEGITSIGSSAFGGCTALSDIVVPDTVTEIGYNVFEDTAWYAAQPDGMVYIGKVAYQYKGNMPENTTVTLRSGTLGIASDCFSRQNNLVSVIFPDGLEYIGSLAFMDTSVTDVVLPESVNEIGYASFSVCKELKSITIPNPDCKINDSSHTINNGSGTDINNVVYHGIINAPNGSSGQAYAEKYGYVFVPIGDIVQGDVNADGTFSVKDIIVMQRWLLHDGTVLKNQQAGDFLRDGVLDVFDLGLMKRTLLEM